MLFKVSTLVVELIRWNDTIDGGEGSVYQVKNNIFFKEGLHSVY